MQQGGSHYGVPPPELTQFSPTRTVTSRAQMIGISGTDHLQQKQQPPQLTEAAASISSRPLPPDATHRPNFDELVPGVSGNFQEDDALAAGEELERGGVPGNRWPRQETLALLKIRSEMDSAFRDATLKGPLWDEISRKLAELGYTRSSKKCKEKFENVHKYYKRTKEGRAGRQDGKSYRFFRQLEALHSGGGGGGGPTTTTTTTLPIAAVATTTTCPTFSPFAPTGVAMAASSERIQPTPLASVGPLSNATRVPPDFPSGATADGVSGSVAGISFSSNTSTSDSSASEDEETEEGLPGDTRKRKRQGAGGGSCSRKMMAFFEGLMKQVMERQEAMQQKFLETIEKREQDRMIREEAWKRQEMARLSQEHENMATDRAFAASRAAAIVGFLQNISGQTVSKPPPIQTVQPPPPPLVVQPQKQTPPPPPLVVQQPTQEPQHHRHHQSNEIVLAPQAPPSEVAPLPQEAPEVVAGSLSIMDPASSRWPKSEVHALIQLRSDLESRYQESGPKGPLWEEISSLMQRMGFNRSAKRCKEKWENINKYFKKVKESNKKRPQDGKTCPYFHQLDALYRKKLLSGGGGSFTDIPNPQERSSTEVLAITAPPPAPPPPPPPPPTDHPHPQRKNGNNNGNGNVSSASQIIPTSNGGLSLNFFEEGASGNRGGLKKPEDIMKELMEQQQQQGMIDDYDQLDEPDSDNMDRVDEEDDDEDDEDRKMDYKIQFQRRNVSSASNGGGNPSKEASAAGSFLAMVQ